MGPGASFKVPLLRVEHGPEPVSDQDEADHREHDRTIVWAVPNAVAT
jgi:hypothetical protein